MDLNTPEAAAARVQIALDVIARLNANTFTPSANNVFLRSDEDEDRWGGRLPRGRFGDADGVREFLREAPRCQACALGALFMAAVDRFNSIKLSDMGPYHWGHSGLDCGGIPEEALAFMRRYFTQGQLQLVEIAFEQGQGGYYAKTDEQRAARDMFPLGQNRGERMRAIMQNIVDNGGTFIPTASAT